MRLEYYRAAPVNGRLVAEAAARERLRVPTLSVGAAGVGDALHRQLAPLTDDLAGVVIPQCGHIVPLHQPQALLDLLVPFLDAPRP